MTQARSLWARPIIALLFGVIFLLPRPEVATAANILIYGPLLHMPDGSRSDNEQTLAAAAGHTVTVKTDAEWAGMTTADFKAYDAIVFPDSFLASIQNCQTTPPSATTNPGALESANRLKWSAAVDGNVVLIGTDPIFHQASRTEPLTLITNAINFAAAVPGKTGLYVALSCYYASALAAGESVELLADIGGFTMRGENENDVTIVDALHPVMTGLTDAGLSNWGESVHETFVSFPVSFAVVAARASTNAPYIIARTVVAPPVAKIATLAGGFDFPLGVAVHDGRVYVAERNAHRVWRIEPDGTRVVVAGTGEAGYNGDGLAALEAQLDSPAGVAVDGFGNVFIADSGNHIIRKVAGDGTISTVAGTPLKLGSAVNGGLATAATLFGPRGVALDAVGNLYIADSINQQVRKVDVVTGVISAVAGVAGVPGNNDGPVSCPTPPLACVPATLNAPLGIAVDAAGDVYIADEGSNRVRQVLAAHGVVQTVDTGPLRRPAGVAVDAEGVIYIADVDNHRIVRVSGETVSTVAGTGTPGFSGDGGAASAAQLHTPVAVAIDLPGTMLYIADLINQRIRSVNFTP